MGRTEITFWHVPRITSLVREELGRTLWLSESVKMLHLWIRSAVRKFHGVGFNTISRRLCPWGAYATPELCLVYWKDWGPLSWRTCGSASLLEWGLGGSTVSRHSRLADWGTHLARWTRGSRFSYLHEIYTKKTSTTASSGAWQVRLGDCWKMKSDEMRYPPINMLISI